MGLAIWIYFALFLISFVYSIYIEDAVQKETNIPLSPVWYVIAAFLSSFLLAGFLDLVKECYNKFILWLMIRKAKRILNRIRKKYNIRDDDTDNQ